MLNADQPYFSYASHDLQLDEASELIRAVRAKHRVQMPELKAHKLLKNAAGRRLLHDVLDAVEGRYIATLYEKRLCLMCKLFEYIYEPVLQSNNALFYRHNLHRFVAMYMYVLMLSKPIEVLAMEFEAFMRSLDPTDAPNLFGNDTAIDGESPFSLILRFARGYNVVIARETHALRGVEAAGKWVLDLTATALFSHLTAWGQRHPLVEVVCDDSKPLRAFGDGMDVMINRPDAVHVDAFGKKRALTWNMTKPFEFASSKNHPGVQIADLIAGVTCALPLAETRLEYREFGKKVSPHLNEDCILPDMTVIDLQTDEAMVNWFALMELADRADRGADPLDGMEFVYEYAKATVPEARQSYLQDM